MEMGDDDSGEVLGLARSLRADDPEVYDEAKGALRELAARAAVRAAGCRMTCGRLFGGGNHRASA